VAGAVLAALAAGVVLAGCGDDGRELSEPDPSQTTTTSTPVAAGSESSPTTILPEGSGTQAEFMRLTSPDFAEGAAMPAANTCAGDDRSPALRLSGVPMGTREVAVVVRDVEAEGFVHWVITNIPAQGGGLKQGEVPAGVIQANNDFGTLGWRGPCPPSGTHYYDIRAYALRSPSGVTQGMPGQEAATLVEAADTSAVAAISVSATAASAG
jgi:Raf kinase inhibitor-like YbhB/YbcL family protein